jgi:hypothetical protein
MNSRCLQDFQGVHEMKNDFEEHDLIVGGRLIWVAIIASCLVCAGAGAALVWIAS